MKVYYVKEYLGMNLVIFYLVIIDQCYYQLSVIKQRANKKRWSVKGLLLGCNKKFSLTNTKPTQLPETFIEVKDSYINYEGKSSAG